MPFWPLELVKETSLERNGLFLKKTRALDSFPTPREAYHAARLTIASLTEDCFSETLTLRFDEKYDVYGVKIGEAGWMLKLTIDESKPQVVVISLHPLEKGPLKTNGGLVQP